MQVFLYGANAAHCITSSIGSSAAYAVVFVSDEQNLLGWSVDKIPFQSIMSRRHAVVGT